MGKKKKRDRLPPGYHYNEEGDLLVTYPAEQLSRGQEMAIDVAGAAGAALGAKGGPVGSGAGALAARWGTRAFLEEINKEHTEVLRYGGSDERRARKEREEQRRQDDSELSDYVWKLNSP